MPSTICTFETNWYVRLPRQSGGGLVLLQREEVKVPPLHQQPLPVTAPQCLLLRAASTTQPRGWANAIFKCVLLRSHSATNLANGDRSVGQGCKSVRTSLTFHKLCQEFEVWTCWPGSVQKTVPGHEDWKPQRRLTCVILSIQQEGHVWRSPERLKAFPDVPSICSR